MMAADLASDVGRGALGSTRDLLSPFGMADLSRDASNPCAPLPVPVAEPGPTPPGTTGPEGALVLTGLGVCLVPVSILAVYLWLSW